MAPEPGLVGTVRLVVTDADTASMLESGNVPALATPRVVRLCEQASLRALEGNEDEGTTTVGQRVQLDHLAPTPVGETVQAEATLESREGRRLVFRVSVTHEDTLIAAGRVTRVIVNRDSFLERLRGESS